jgi:molybdate transport system ATP-binding protein
MKDIVTSAQVETSGFHLQLSLSLADFTLKIDQRLPAQGITVLFGPSGSGKTTVLRCLAGLERATGVISLKDEIWQNSASNIFRPTWQREIGYVFQEASLFEHMDVRANLHFGLRRVKGIDRAEKTQDLDAAVALLGIAHLLDRSVTSLSGGERQRVAIARALATCPKLLLLDEPLASLDIARRKEVLPWLERLHQELLIPILYVTHSMDELVRLADHVVLLDKGTVQGSGSISQVLGSHEVARLLGDEASVIAMVEVTEQEVQDQTVRVRFGGGHVWVPDNTFSVGQALRLRILARDVSLSLTKHEDTTIQNCLQGAIEAIEPDVSALQALVRVRCGQEVLLSRVPQQALSRLGLIVGSSVWCQIKSMMLLEKKEPAEAGS